MARREILDLAIKTIAEIDQIHVDVAYWNRMHPDEEPLDPDPDGSLRRSRDTVHRVVDDLSAPDTGGGS